MFIYFGWVALPSGFPDGYAPVKIYFLYRDFKFYTIFTYIKLISRNCASVHFLFLESSPSSGYAVSLSGKSWTD